MMAVGRTPDDLVFGAYIEDKTEEFFDLFDERVDETAKKAEEGFDDVGKSIEGVEGAMGDAAKGMKGSIPDIEAIEGALGGVKGAMSGTVEGFRTGVGMIDEVLVGLEGSIGGVSIATLAMSATVVLAFLAVASAVKRLIKEMERLARPTADAIRSMEYLAKIHGITAEETAIASDEIEAFGISSEVASRSVVEMIRANIDLADTQKLVAKAANIAATTGDNTINVFNGIIQAIKDLNVEALKQYDIFLDESTVMEDFAKSVDRPVESLTELEKIQALTNAALADTDRHLGAYDESSKSTTRQTDDLAVKMNELKVAFGLAFQPIHAQRLAFLNEKVAEMIKWVEENRDTLKDWATVIGNVLLKVLQTVEKLARGLIWLFGIPKRLARGTHEAILLAFNIPEDEITARIDGVGVAFRQLVAIVVGAVATAVDTVMIFVNQTIDSFGVLGKVMKAAMKGDLDEIMVLFDDFADRQNARMGDGDFFGQMKDTFKGNVAEMGDLLNIMGDVADESVEVDAAFASMEDSAASLNDSLEEATNAFGDLFKEYQMEIAREAVLAGRRLVEEQLRTTHKLQDIQRNYNRAIKDALEGAEQERSDAIQKHNETRLDILRDYHRRVSDIRQDFNRNAHELARKRDAVGLMELIRSNKYKLEEEMESRNERISDQDRLFQGEIKHIKRRKQEEIAAINERRQAEIESMQRSLARQRELEALHRQWQIEDRQEKYRQRLEDMVSHYVNEENLTYEHLQNMLKQFQQYFTGLNQMLAHQMSMAGTTGGATMNWEDLQRQKQRDSGILGQGGLVSSMLPPNRAFNIPMDSGASVPRIPTTYPGSEGSGSRDINVSVTGDALDPIIQRELVRSLLEIERNRG